MPKNFCGEKKKLKFTLISYNRNTPDEDLLNDVISVSKKLDKIPIELATAMQKPGNSAEYVIIEMILNPYLSSIISSTIEEIYPYPLSLGCPSLP